MKNNFKKLTLYFVSAFLIASCKSNETLSPSLGLPAVTATIFPTKISETSSPIPTFIRPTLEADKTFEYTVGLLKANNLCNLPCFWEVTPGKLWNSARQQLSYFVPYISDTQQGVSTTLHEIPSNVGLGKLGISFNISILEKNDVVESISAQLMSENFAESLKTFMPQEIFSKYGTPETILLFLSNDLKEPEYQFFHLWLVYEEKNFFVLYSGYAIQNQDVYQVCPTTQHFEREGYSDKYGTVEFGSVSGKDRRILIDFMSKEFAPIDFIYTHSKVLESVSYYSNDEFVNLFLNDGMACITTPIKLWSTLTK